MAEESNVDLAQDPRSIIGTRVFDAPRELVFSAFTDPKHLAEWWGPNGFTTTTHAFDLRPGGKWRFVMHGPDGRDYQNLIILRRNRSAGTPHLSSRRRRRRRACAVHPNRDLRGPRQRSNPIDLARQVPVGRGTRACHQGIRRRQGSGADHGAASRLCCLDGGKERVTDNAERSTSTRESRNAPRKSSGRTIDHRPLDFGVGLHPHRKGFGEQGAAAAK